MRHRLPAALLVVVAIAQIALTQRAGLSPWKGGGFGMFSTLDGRPHRAVAIRVEAPNRSEALAVPPSLEASAATVEILPTPANLDRFAHEIAARERRHGREVGSVHLEVWRDEFDREDLTPSRRRIANRVVRVDRRHSR
jgi:hypothetical protein